jgi:hypothetical protein
MEHENILTFRPDTPMSEIAKAVKKLLGVMRKNGMGSLLCDTNGYRISVQPASQTPEQP